MTESNLAANLFPSEVSHTQLNHGDNFEVNGSQVNSNPTPDLNHQELTELIALRQEVAHLQQRCRDHEQDQQQRLTESERLHREIKHLKLELNHTEATAKELQRSLHSQLQHSWEQQQHDLITSFAKLRAIDQERLAHQEQQIQELNEQKLLLEAKQLELENNLETALLEMAQNTKTLQKLQSSPSNSHREQTRNISLQSVLEQSIRSLQNEYTNSQNRIKELEHQIGELQEQILQQSGQAIEYEAAVQHWREKSLIHQNHAIQLSTALERFIDGKDIPKIIEPNKVDLPSFLIRQRTG
ncbi:hypothetical protein Syn7502_00955 [Synechococcus sp. PCC 7502]|uniref:hypothetical protein n=1 Tax=Synechococcus sp. PCC 7502 TaxID=1173263 RepID=UPI00029FE58C|nr:hypothetical protein [Synechococcus sp. PCC 7502]AFY73070.1 hypothetical protein Syn7502_00955 [Synechococcus sp. PCC 7502]